MIFESDLRPIGKLLKPHGICGEITALLMDDIDLRQLSCIILQLDGIFVPFFLRAVRPKSSETDLVLIDGVNDEAQAARLCPNEFFALADELPETGDSDGVYTADMIGFAVEANGTALGKIVEIDDTTANYLFIIEKNNGERCLIPVADEFITGLDADTRRLSLDLPQGLLDL